MIKEIIILLRNVVYSSDYNKDDWMRRENMDAWVCLWVGVICNNSDDVE